MNDSLHGLCIAADDDAVWREQTIFCVHFFYIYFNGNCTIYLLFSPSDNEIYFHL